MPSLNDFPERSWTRYPGTDYSLPIDDLPGVNAILTCYSHSFFSALSHMLAIGYGLGFPQVRCCWVAGPCDLNRHMSSHATGA